VTQRFHAIHVSPVVLNEPNKNNFTSLHCMYIYQEMEQSNVQLRTKKLRACASKKEKKSRKLKQKRENKTQKIQVMKMRSVKKGGALFKFYFCCSHLSNNVVGTQPCLLNEWKVQTDV